MSTVNVGSARYAIVNLGKSLVFNGASDLMEVTQATGFPFYASNTQYSISFFIKPNSFGATAQCIFGEGNTSGTSPVFLLGTLLSGTKGQLSLLLRDDEANVLVNNVTTFSRPLDVNKFNHVVISDDNGTVHVYINGVEDSVSITGSFNYTRTGTFSFTKSTIGALVRNTTSNYLDGSLVDMRFIQKAVSADEAYALSRMQYPTLTMAARFNFNDNVTDQTGNGNSGTLTGTTYSSDVPFGILSSQTLRLTIPSSTDKSVQLSGSALRIPLAPSTAGWNIGVWIKNVTLGANTEVISYTNNSNGGFHFYQINSTSRLFFQLFNGATNEVNASAGNNSTTTGVWQHWVLSYAPNNFKLYLNGVLVATDTACTMNDPNVAQTLTLGRASWTAGLASQVILSNFVLHNTSTPWTQKQVSDLCTYNAIPAGANVIVPLNSNANDISGNGNNGTLTGGTFVTDIPYASRQAASGRTAI